MHDPEETETFTAFAGPERLANGPWSVVATSAQRAASAGLTHIVVLSDLTGRTCDYDSVHASSPPKPARGRPRLGVTAREVTLLPRHWEWLAQQPGGASAALRRLVEAARKADVSETRTRLAEEALHRAMTTLAGNLPQYEEALRSLYAGDIRGLEAILSAWPRDISAYLLGMMPAARKA